MCLINPVDTANTTTAMQNITKMSVIFYGTYSIDVAWDDITVDYFTVLFLAQNWGQKNCIPVWPCIKGLSVTFENSRDLCASHEATVQIAENSKCPLVIAIPNMFIDHTSVDTSPLERMSQSPMTAAQPLAWDCVAVSHYSSCFLRSIIIEVC